jgi:hypothetical protein
VLSEMNESLESVADGLGDLLARVERVRSDDES